MPRVAWIVPGFSSSEDDWCIPALLDLTRHIGRSCDLNIVAMRYPYRRDVYKVGPATVYSIGGGHHRPSHTPRIWRDTAQAVRRIRPDVIHAFWAYEPGVIAAWLSSRSPAIISLAGGELVSLPDIGYGLMGRRRTRIALRWALRRAAAVTAGSSYLAECAQHLGRFASIHRIPLGVDLVRWPFSPRNGQPKCIMNVGSLEPVKDQALLLQAFKRVLQGVPSARLRIAGEGRELSRLIALTQRLDLTREVDFLGAVPHDELPSFHSGASLFVQCSRYEAQGMALLEAAACGVPVAGTQVGALADLTPEAAIGTPPGDAHALADAISELLLNREKATRLGAAAREKIERLYRVETAAERFLLLYASLA